MNSFNTAGCRLFHPPIYFVTSGNMNITYISFNQLRVNQMPHGKSVRKVVKVGKSLFVTLPNAYVRNHRIKPGDYLEVVFNDYLHLKPISMDELQGALERAREVLSVAKKEGGSR